MNQSLQELRFPSRSQLSGQEYNLTNLTDPVNLTNMSSRNLVRDPHLENFEKVIHWMNIYFLPTLILVGLIGNSLSVCVFILSHLRRLSSSVYLAALAVADAGFLLCVLPEWFLYMGFQFSHKNGKFCSPCLPNN